MTLASMSDRQHFLNFDWSDKLATVLAGTACSMAFPIIQEYYFFPLGIVSEERLPGMLLGILPSLKVKNRHTDICSIGLKYCSQCEVAAYTKNFERQVCNNPKKCKHKFIDYDTLNTTQSKPKQHKDILKTSLRCLMQISYLNDFQNSNNVEYVQHQEKKRRGDLEVTYLNCNRRDAISVALYVRECYQMEHNPIVYYKPQCRFDDSGLKQEDLCLILMNKSQQDMLFAVLPLQDMHACILLFVVYMYIRVERKKINKIAKMSSAKYKRAFID
ncbi:hypothetical protein HUJ05_007590 [Dendroctonus ponderosae]|nr:hypothetical protein HUJ05_007590 [Dendroctonus ponderosae]